MTRYFKITTAAGRISYASVDGDQPDPEMPQGGSVLVLDEPFVIPPFVQPAPPPPSITRRQLILALLGAGLITGEDALAAATTGATPAAFSAILATLPPDQALAAQITWASMAVAERSSPLFTLLVAAGLATGPQIDALFIAGKAL